MNPYEILGIRQNASVGEIEDAYRKLVMQYLGASTNDEHGEMSQPDSKLHDLNQAYMILSDPVRRASWDRQPNSEHPLESPSTSSEFAAKERLVLVTTEKQATSALTRALDEMGGATKAVLRRARRIAKSSPFRFLPSGTYAISEVNERVKSLLEIASFRVQARRIYFTCWFLAFAAIAAQFIFEVGPDDLVLGLQVAGAYAVAISTLCVGLPLLLLQVLSRVILRYEFRSNAVGWGLHIFVPIICVAFFFSSSAGSSEAVPNPSDSARGVWVEEFSEGDQSTKGTISTYLRGRKGDHKLILAYDKNNNETTVVVDFGEAVSGVSSVYYGSLLPSAGWSAELGSSGILKYRPSEADAIKLVKQIAQNTKPFTLEATAGNGTTVRAEFDPADSDGAKAFVALREVAAVDLHLEREQKRLKAEIRRLDDEIEASELALEYSKIMMEEMGGGKELEVKLLDWSRSTDGGLRIRFNMGFTSYRPFLPYYWIEGTLVVDSQQEPQRFVKSRGNFDHHYRNGQ